MITIEKREKRPEHDYCPRCGGLVDFTQCRALLVSPPIREYLCSSCHQVAIRIRGD